MDKDAVNYRRKVTNCFSQKDGQRKLGITGTYFGMFIQSICFIYINPLKNWNEFQPIQSRLFYEMLWAYCKLMIFSI